MRRAGAAAVGARRERGDTLIEVLVAVVVMAVAFAVIVGGIGTAIIGASVQHNRSTADSLVRSAADKLSADPYTVCATGAPADYPLPAAPSGFTVTVTGVAFWNGTDGFDSAMPASCPRSDAGVQLITLTAAPTSTGIQVPQASTLEVVKRQP